MKILFTVSLLFSSLCNGDDSLSLLKEKLEKEGVVIALTNDLKSPEYESNVGKILNKLESVEGQPLTSNYLYQWVKYSIANKTWEKKKPNSPVLGMDSYFYEMKIRKALSLIVKENPATARKLVGLFKKSPIYRYKDNGAWDPRYAYKGLRGIIAEAVQKSGDDVAIGMMNKLLLDVLHDIDSKLAIVYGKRFASKPQQTIDFLNSVKNQPVIQPDIKSVITELQKSTVLNK